MSLREIYDSNYALEHARKAGLTSALALPVGVVSVLVGSLIVMAKDLHPPFQMLEQVQLTAVILSAIACAFSGYFLFRSLYNYGYAYVPTPQELKKYNDQLFAFHQANGQSIAEARALAEFETLGYIDDENAKNASWNAANNDTKSTYLHRAYGAIFAAVLAASVAGVAYVFNSIASPHPVNKVEIVNLKEALKMTHPTSTQSPATQNPPQQPVQPTRPSPPPSRVIKEDTNPPRPAPLKK